MADIRYYQKENEDFYITEFGYSAPQQEKRVPTRIRDVYLLHIVIQGICHFSLFDAPAGSAFLICKGQSNSFTVEPGYIHYWFGFDGKDVPRILAAAGLPASQHALFNVKGFSFIPTLLAQAHNYHGSDASAVAEGAFRCILTLISNKSTNLKQDIEVIRDFIDCNYHRPLSMEQLAKHVHLSEKHLCRKFSAAYGKPPQKYLIEIRMAKARVLLESTDLRIKEIAFSVGYTSQLHFSAMYKKHHGVPPSAHRKGCVAK